MLTIGDIKKWADKEVMPMAWFRVALRLSPEFRKREIIGYLIDDTEIKDPEILSIIQKEFLALYKVPMPLHFNEMTK